MDFVRLDQFTDGHLGRLLEGVEGVKVSLIMPLQREVDKRSENRIRFKNLFRSAQEELSSLDFRQTDNDQLLAPAQDLFQGGRFLTADSPGLAIYLALDFSLAFQLPYVPEEMVMVSDQFLIKPLLPLRLQEYFYILALSQQDIRLLRASQYTAERMDLGDMPQGLAEALRWEDPERELQWHSQTGSMAGDGRAAMFHGHGLGTKEVQRKNLIRYFQLLDPGLSKRLVNEDAPLVLAGVDYLLPIYREVSSYQNIVEEEVTGSPKHLDDGEMQQQAWRIVQPYFSQKQEAAVALYHQQISRKLASADVPTIISAAHQGRVATLFVAMDEQNWGAYDPDSGRIDIHSHPQPGDGDLLNLAAIYTTLNKGVVYASPRENLPDEEPLAAIFRF